MTRLSFKRILIPGYVCYPLNHIIHISVLTYLAIFRLSNAAISKIYRELKCQHYLIQDMATEIPQIPALTPEGFQRWMTLMIQAHPQAEFDRLSIAVRDMPISNADDRKERFPKELSRRLLPKYDNVQVRQYVGAALAADGQVSVPRHTSFPPPPPQGQPLNSFGERERAPYATQVPLESRSFDSNEEDGKPNSFPIERERKPYTAKEGMGKIYKDDDSTASSSTLKPEPSRRRAKSTVGGDRDSVYSDPSRANENAQSSSHHHSSHAKPTTRRARSPTKDNPYVRSEGSVGDVPASYYSSNIYSGERGDDRYSRDSERPRDRDRDRDRDRERERDRERDRERERERDRDRDRDREREREAREREIREKDEWTRRLATEEDFRLRAEEDRRYSRYDGGEPLSRRTTADSAYASNGYPPSYPPPPLGTGERRYG
jgi:hypothetical protein